jgi:RimJ/RimL family protein N-acetyltransferase
MKDRRPTPIPAKRRAATRPTPKPRPVRATAAASRANAETVKLVRTRGTPGRGAGPSGEAWRIEEGGKRAGVVFINLVDEAPIGRHASIQIFLNAKSQGRGIGRIAYRLACEASAHRIIYAHMRKSNHASRRAAEEAGFIDATALSEPQLVMVRRRSP